jgi:membrane protease YdiL (CAAX protease family)
MAFACPVEIALILMILQLRTQACLYQVGFTASRFGPNVLLGFLSWLVLTPGILFLNVLTQQIYELLTPFKPEPHPIQKLMQDSPVPIDWVVTVLTAIVAAPLVEELIYRGVLQQWLRCLAVRSDVIVGVSVVLAVFSRQNGNANAVSETEHEMALMKFQPLIFVAALIPIYLYIRSSQRNPAPGAIFASSLLFAIAHAMVWPSPIPLFPLGLALGWLAYRTQSLVPGIVFHMLFNGVALLGLTHQPPPDPPKGKPATSTAARPVDVSASSFVPGSSEPRRT